MRKGIKGAKGLAPISRTNSFLRKTWETTAVLQNMQKICYGNVLRHLENETKVEEKENLGLFVEKAYVILRKSTSFSTVFPNHNFLI